MNITIYQILIWTVPILLAVLGFIGALGVNALISMSKDLNEIKINLNTVATKHQALEERVDRIEEKVL